MPKSTENWFCNGCHQEKDLLYFVGEEELCRECKKKVILIDKKVIPVHENMRGGREQ